MASIFQFKQFAVDQTGCAMKINTDGVLLGAMVNADGPKRILDIGTGTGVIALMLAQRFKNAQIDAVEIDKNAAATADKNFKNSPFADRLKAYAMGFEEFFDLYSESKYDLIVSNPPFYINSLLSPKNGKAVAKHADEGFFEELLKTSSAHLTEKGSFWLILPVNTAVLVKSLAEESGLFLTRLIEILSYPDSVPHREILAFSAIQKPSTKDSLVIYQQEKEYSGEYKLLLKDFLTIF